MSTRSATHVRPLEPSDAPAVHRFSTAPGRCGAAGTSPWDPEAVTEARLSDPEAQRLGAWAGDVLRGHVELELRKNLRTRHVAGLRLVADDGADAATLLDAALDLAWGWLGVNRVEIELPAGDRAVDWLHHAGFVDEVRKRRHRTSGEGVVDTVGLALLRAGYTPPRFQTAPPAWPEQRAAGPLTLRAARPSDAEAFANNLREPSVRWGTLQVASTPNALWTGRLTRRDRDHGTMIVAELDGRVVGHAGLHPEPFPSHRCAAIGMTVSTAAQGRGVGTALMTALLDAARRFGLDRVGLEVYPDNARAIALYTRFGFVPEGVRRDAAWRDGAVVDSMVMGLVLEPTAADRPRPGG